MKRKISVAVLAAVLLVAMVGTVVAGELHVGDAKVYVQGLDIDVRAQVTKVDKYGNATVKFYHENKSGNFIGWCKFTVTPLDNVYILRGYNDINSVVRRHDKAKTVSEFVQGNKLTKGSFTLSFNRENIEGFLIEVDKK